MQGSNLGLQKWALAVYLLATGIKGVSSMKLHRDLGVTQKTAWHLGHRIREALEDHRGLFAGPVEIDETYVGGIERNKHNRKKLRAGRGAVGKTAVVGVKNRATNDVIAAPVASVDSETLGSFIQERVGAGAKLYTDGSAAYPMDHEAVRHSAWVSMSGAKPTPMASRAFGLQSRELAEPVAILTHLFPHDALPSELTPLAPIPGPCAPTRRRAP